MPSPLYFVAALIHVETFISNPNFGWKYYKDLAKNGALLVVKETVA